MSGCNCPDVSWRDIAHGAGLCGPDALALSQLHLRDVHFVRPSTVEDEVRRDSVRALLTLDAVRQSQSDIIQSLKEQLDASRLMQGTLQAELAQLRVNQSEANPENVVLQLNYIRASRLYLWVWRFRRLFRSDSLWAAPVRPGDS
jgi:hypothetical protein